MSARIDPIVVSVVQHRLLALVAEMGEAMLRTAYSQILNSSRDFSTAICDLSGRLIAQAEHVPIHVGALPYAARAITEYLGDDVNRGDVFLLNDPYHGGNHLPDLTAFVPVFGPIRIKEVGIAIRPGDVLILESGGGGGWGDPAERDPAARAQDLKNGFWRGTPTSSFGPCVMFLPCLLHFLLPRAQCPSGNITCSLNKLPSPPRKRGSRANAVTLEPWIPASAGMTTKLLKFLGSFPDGHSAFSRGGAPP